MRKLRECLGETPLLYTLRTRAEGGNAQVDVDEYLRLNQAAIHSGCLDLVDVEILRGDDTAFLLVEEAHRHHTAVIGSSHDFSGTPKKEAIIMRLCQMPGAGDGYCENGGDAKECQRCTDPVRCYSCHERTS